jgi:hypothetical protein
MSVIDPSCTVACDRTDACGCNEDKSVERHSPRAAAATALAAAGCVACCILPLTLPPVIVGSIGGLLALLGHAHGSEAPDDGRDGGFDDISDTVGRGCGGLAAAGAIGVHRARRRKGRSSEWMMDWLTGFGLFAVTMMLVCYALEERAVFYTLLFAGACLLASVYGFLQGAWPFGVVEAIWSVVALRRWTQSRSPGRA